MLAAALEAEVDADLAELAHERDERGRRLVVRNGHAQPRQVMTSAGAIVRLGDHAEHWQLPHRPLVPGAHPSLSPGGGRRVDGCVLLRV
ncbi:hypothetical protein GCM10022255_101020 [Dactylosporangium darangshiense]|uniref:Uncharacterized protein n=1 Tax=Dactylosporangium darangshiense TaxID=579108 RepID=A0ABP8DRY0_9ACTN